MKFAGVKMMVSGHFGKIFGFCLLLLMAADILPAQETLSAEEYFKRGTANKNCAEAVADFNEAIELNPQEARYYKARGECLTDIKSDGAAADFSKAIALKPNYAEAYLGRAIVYFNKFLSGEDMERSKEKALFDFDQSLKHDPKCSACYFNRAKFYFWARETEAKVFGDLDKAIELEPRNREYLIFTANMRCLIDDVKCVADCNKLLEINPKDTDALILRGQSYYALREFQKAVDDFTLAIENTTFPAFLYPKRANAYRALGKIKEAEADEKQFKLLTGKN
jgi:tetratricopeptide (TPR) repeat protein